MTLLEKIGLVIGMTMAIVLLWMIFFSTNGVYDYMELKKKEAAIHTRFQEESRKNKVLEKEINRLKHDLDYIRHKARVEHGMAAPDELIFKRKKK